MQARVTHVDLSEHKSIALSRSATTLCNLILQFSILKKENKMEYEEYEDYELESYGEEETNLIDSSPFDSRTTVESVYEQCMEPTVLSAVDQVIWLLFACLIFRICTQLGNT